MCENPCTSLEYAIRVPSLCHRSACGRVHCNGQRHEFSTQYVYPTCHNCGIELCDLIELLAEPTARNPSACDICNKEYISDTDRRTHFNTHFYRSKQRYEHKFFCVTCDEAFTRPQRLAGDDSLYACVDCHNNYAHEFELNYHRFLMHGTRLPQKHLDSEDDSNEEELDGNCEAFATKNEIIEQCEKANTPSDYLYCRLCGSDGQRFASRMDRNRHENQLHRNAKSRMYACQYCSKEFANIGKLDTHQSVHTLVVPANYVCGVCGKGFRERGKLKAHTVTHTDERPYQCGECGKYYKSLGAVQKHKSHFHVADRRFKCPQCDKTYRDASDLRRHKWTHGGREKHFVCGICEMRFYEQKNLNAHARRHAALLTKKKIVNAEVNVAA